MTSATRHFRRTTSREQKCKRLAPSRPVIGSVWPSPNENFRHAMQLLMISPIDTIRVYPRGFAPWN